MRSRPRSGFTIGYSACPNPIPLPNSGAAGDFKSYLNPNSLEVVQAKLEPALRDAKPDECYQFERLGYFTLDPDSAANKQVWNRTITLKDTWAKEEEKKSKQGAAVSSRRNKLSAVWRPPLLDGVRHDRCARALSAGRELRADDTGSARRCCR